MGSYIYLLAISFGWSLLFCDATVTVSLFNSANGVDTLECRSYGVVSCHINPYAGLSSWEINGTPYAMCTPGCLADPNFPRNYSSTYDVINGVFNLTVDSVTFNDSSTTFKCDDGYTFDSITIGVAPAYSEYNTSITGTDEGKQVGFTTACVKPGVEFYWFTVKIDNSYREAYNTDQNEMTNTTKCSFDSDCGGVGTGKVSSLITIPTVSNRLLEEERYLEVVVKYKNPDAERSFRFTEKFHFKECKLLCRYIIVFIYLVRWIQHLTSFFAGSLLCALFKNNASEISTRTKIILYMTCIPLIGSGFAMVFSCTKLSKGRTNSCRVFFKALIGYLPLFGTIYTACLLYCELKERSSCGKYKTLVLTFFGKCKNVLFTIFWICDIGIFVLMILTCIDIIKIPCYQYGVYAAYAFASLIFSWMNFVCLAECLQTEINQIGNEPILLCDSCKQLNNKSQVAELICLYCNTILCEKCIEEHLKIHNKKRKKPGYDKRQKKSNKIGNKPKFLCDSCKQLMKESKAKLLCFDCNTVLCEKCTQEHLKRHTALKTKTFYVQKKNENNPIENGPNLLCESCNKSKAELYCIDCITIVCEKCTQGHLKGHITLGKHSVYGETRKKNNKIEDEPKQLCESCKKLLKKSKAVLKCIDCDTILCEMCTQEHLNGQTQNENSNTGAEPLLQCDSCKRIQIESKAEIKCFDCNEVLCGECTEDHLIRHNQMRNDPSYGQTSNNMNRIPDNFICSTCENNVESYCLTCQQYLCKACIINHAEHRILRHCQHEAGKTKIEIFCKFCQNKDKKADAKYYSRGDTSFVCEECKLKKGLKHIIDVNDLKWQCKRCEDKDNHTIYPVECQLIDNENICSVCFETNRKQLSLLPKPIGDKKNRHKSVCALHSVSGLPDTQHFKPNTIRKRSSDVYCYVCNEYLCTRCFYLHIRLELLWKQHQFDQEFKKNKAEQAKQNKLCEKKSEEQLLEPEQLDEKHTAEQVKQEHIIVVICEQETEGGKKNQPEQWIFNGCFPFFGMFATIYKLCSIKENTRIEITGNCDDVSGKK